MEDIAVLPIDVEREEEITAFGAWRDKEAIGVIAGMKTGHRMDIKSLFVSPGYRRRGVGRALMDQMREHYFGKGVYLNAEFTMEGEKAYSLSSFLEAMGFEENSRHFPAYYMGRVRDLKANRPIPPKLKSYIFPLSEIKEKNLKETSRSCLEKGDPLPNEGLTGQDVDRDLSFCIFEKENIRSYITARAPGKDLVHISSMWSTLPGLSGQSVLFEHMSEVLRDKYEGDTRILFLVWDALMYQVINEGMHSIEQLSYSYSLTGL